MTTNKLLIGFFGFIALLIALFILQNLSVIPVKFLFWSFEIRRVWLVFSLYSAGLLSGLILAFLFNLSHSIKNNNI